MEEPRHQGLPSAAHEKAGEDFRGSETRYRRLVEQAGDAFFVHDLAGRFLDVNDRACESLGYSRGELLAMAVADIETTFDPVGFGKMWRSMGSGEPLTVHGIHRRKDGATFPVEVRLGLLEPGDHPLYLAIVRDISERRRLEEELRQAQKTEAVGRLAGGIAHDFNNLLTAVMGYTAIVLDRVGPGFPLRAELEEVKRAGERAAALTRQLLAFSRRQMIHPKVLDLNVQVSAIEKMLRRIIPESIRFELALAPDLGRVRADPGQIDQVVMNLALNARDAMPDGGTLTLATANAELSPSDAGRCPGMKPGGHVVLAVSDTGTGIPKEMLPHLFEPFYTTKGEGKGTGLGLATVHGIAKQSNGFITVASKAGDGTTFRVYLPRVEERAPGPSDSQIIVSVWGSETVLLAEDDGTVRLLVREALRAHGYRVLDAKDALEALRLAEREKDRIDLLLTDMVMPGMKGRELAISLRARYPGLKVLYMSGYTDDAALIRGKLEAGEAFIPKPFLPNEILSKVRKMLLKPRSGSQP
jgi:hypothetical protein